jgi:DNA-binding CsgD family transcriptional regulator
VKGLTPKETKLINKIASGKTKRQAGLESGYSPKSVSAIVSQNLKKTKIQTALQKALEKAGLNDTRLAKKHVELLDANKTVSAVCGKDAGAGSVDFVDVPDYQVQCKALDMAYKLKGGYIEKVEMEHKGEVAHVVQVVDYSGMVKKI